MHADRANILEYSENPHADRATAHSNPDSPAPSHKAHKAHIPVFHSPKARTIRARSPMLTRRRAQNKVQDKDSNLIRLELTSLPPEGLA